MINITLRQLTVFEAVARHLSYTRAAETLHLSQPAISMQIKQLEEVVETPLFEQFGKKIYLTAAGEAFQPYCQNIIQQLNDVETLFANFKGMYGKLTVCVATTAGYFMPQLLAAFCKQYPNTQVSLNVTNRETLLKLLSHNEMDLAIMGRPPEGHDLDAVSFMENPLVIIAPTDHPLAHERNIPMARLTAETFLVREQGSGTRIAMEQFFAERKIALTTGTEMSTNEAIKQAVQAGMGLGILSLHTVQLELETHRLAVLDVENFPIQRHWYIIHRQGKQLSTVANTFKAFLIENS
jgi:DNA-binding transcriptional LysR family regulator